MVGVELEKWARETVIKACRLELKRPITLEEVQAVQVIGRLESLYGRGWSNTANGPGSEESHNWGAIQFIKGKAADLVSGSFVTQDSHRDGTTYRFPYCSYSDDVNGCRHLVRLMEQMGALKVARDTRQVRAVSSQLGRRGYYEGRGKNAAEAYWNHYQACKRHLATIAAACGDTGKGLNNADSESPLPGATYLEDDQGEQSEAHERESSPEGSGASSGEGREQESAQAQARDQANEEAGPPPVVEEPEAPASGPRALDVGDVRPASSRARAIIPPALVAAVVAAILAALQCQGCSPAELAAGRAVARSVAGLGGRLCHLIPDPVDRALCEAAADVLEAIHEESTIECEAGAGGAGGAGGRGP